MQEWKRLIFTQSGSISSHTLVPRSLFRYACNIYLVIVSRLVTHLTTNATYHNTTLISLFRYFLLHCTMEKLQWEVGNKNFSFLREKYIWNIWTRIKWEAKLKILSEIFGCCQNERLSWHIDHGRNEQTLCFTLLQIERASWILIEAS